MQINKFACGLTLLAIALITMGKIGSQNQKLLAECKPVYGIAQCELKILGR
jgi:hypothetical protein